MPARYLPMLPNACQYPDNTIQCHSSALQCSAVPCGLFDVAGKLRQARSRLACPMRTCTSSISSFRGVGLLFLTQGSFQGSSGWQARRLAGSQAWEYMMYVSVSGSQIATAFQHTTNTPPQLSQAESPANGPGLCDVRAFCLSPARGGHS